MNPRYRAAYVVFTQIYNNPFLQRLTAESEVLWATRLYDQMSPQRARDIFQVYRVTSWFTNISHFA